MRVWNRFKSQEKGLTLVELLAVIVILGVIAAIAVPSVTGIINSTKTKARNATAQQIYNAARLYVTTEDAGQFSDYNTTGSKGELTLQDLIDKKYLQSGLTDPKTGDPLDTDKTVIYWDSAGTTATEELWYDVSAAGSSTSTPTEIDTDSSADNIQPYTFH